MKATDQKHVDVLVVDDKQDIRESLVRMVSMWGYQVVSAGDGEAAVSIARDYRPRYALVDKDMPKKNGIETVLELKNMIPDAHIELMSIRSLTQEEQIQLKPYAIPFHRKPFIDQRIRSSIETACGKKTPPSTIGWQRILERATTFDIVAALGAICVFYLALFSYISWILLAQRSLIHPTLALMGLYSGPLFLYEIYVGLKYKENLPHAWSPQTARTGRSYHRGPSPAAVNWGPGQG
jgi:CheY-like chemotaxis protein